MTTKFVHGLKHGWKVAATQNTAPCLDKVKNNADAARHFRELDNVWNTSFQLIKFLYQKHQN